MPSRHPQRVCLFTTLFDMGGVITYWQTAIDRSPGTQWYIFANGGTAFSKPFEQKNIQYVYGIKWPKFWRTSQEFWRFFWRERPEIIFLNGTLAEALVWSVILFLRLFCRVEIVCVYHNALIYRKLSKSWMNRLLLSFFGWFHHRNIFVSEAVARYWGCPGNVLHKPFSLGQKQDLATPTIFRLGFLGRLSWEKGPDRFLSAVLKIQDSLKATGISIEALVYGEGAWEPPAATPSWVKWQGWTREPKKALRELSVLMTTSRSEGYPLGLVESLEVGTPVFGYSVGGCAEVLGPMADLALVKDGNEEELIEKIVRFIRNYPQSYHQYFAAAAPTSGVDLEAQWLERLFIETRRVSRQES